MSAEHDTIKHLHETWVLGSTRQTYLATKDSQGGSTPLAAFILVSCAIDFLAGFMCGITSFKPSAGESSRIYKAFVTKYLPQYDPEDVYINVRCRLAHNYTIGEDVALTNLKPQWHDPKGQNGQKTINFEDFCADFQAGARVYFNDLTIDPNLQAAFLRRFALGFAVPAPRT
jgi:hypothetical protein